jgi:hypothetical protein
MSDLFRFVQFEFPFGLGPADGRYVLRDHADEGYLRVVVLATLGAPQRRLLGRKRARSVDPEPPPAPVPTTRATIVRGHPVDEETARRWLSMQHSAVRMELAILNHVLALHRVAAADPTVREVGLEQAVAVRIGFGAGEQVADGRWTEAVEPGEERGARRGARDAALRPQERLAALLGGRDAPLAAEELTLRARLDLDASRWREAALQLRVALEAAIAELGPWAAAQPEVARGTPHDLAARVEELREERKDVGSAANAALQGGLDERTTATVERALTRVESALRARSAGM